MGDRRLTINLREKDMTDNGRTIIEVNGVKLSVDLRHAVRVDELRVGDHVKVLVKSYSDYAVHPGIIIGFEPFAKLPTIIAAYMEVGYGKCDLKFVHFNASSKDVEIVKAIDDDRLDLNRLNVEKYFDAEITKLQNQITDLENKRSYFRDNFRSYWTNVHKAPVEGQ
jgi:hypothetical protein